MINPWTVTLSVNAGLALNTEGLRLWVDAVHDEKVPEFSTLTPELQDRLFETEAFQNPDLICFTHCHPDHFSKALCQRTLERFPRAEAVLPEPFAEGQIRLSGGEQLLTVKGRILSFHRLTHEGPQFREVPHYGMLIEDEGETILILGDCAIADPGLREWVAGREIDTLIAPFPWITLPKGRAFLQEYLRPERMIVCHLPLPEDDRCYYRRAARQAAERLRDFAEIKLMMEPFQEETLS